MVSILIDAKIGGLRLYYLMTAACGLGGGISMVDLAITHSHVISFVQQKLVSDNLAIGTYQVPEGFALFFMLTIEGALM